MNAGSWRHEPIEKDEVVVCEGNRCGRSIRWPENIWRRERPHDKTIEELCDTCYARQEFRP